MWPSGGPSGASCCLREEKNTKWNRRTHEGHTKWPGGHTKATRRPHEGPGGHTNPKHREVHREFFDMPKIFSPLPMFLPKAEKCSRRSSRRVTEATRMTRRLHEPSRIWTFSNSCGLREPKSGHNATNLVKTNNYLTIYTSIILIPIRFA